LSAKELPAETPKKSASFHGIVISISPAFEKNYSRLIDKSAMAHI
jgi:hypothetical protein